MNLPVERFPTDGSIVFFLCIPEYDRHLAAAVKAGKTMATAYLDPNLNHAFLGGAKSRLSAAGSDRTAAGSVDRVLKVFHHFETNTEQDFWSSNIRYGDATDVRVRVDLPPSRRNSERLLYLYCLDKTHPCKRPLPSPLILCCALSPSVSRSDPPPPLSILQGNTHANVSITVCIWVCMMSANLFGLECHFKSPHVTYAHRETHALVDLTQNARSVGTFSRMTSWGRLAVFRATLTADMLHASRRQWIWIILVIMVW